MQILATHYHPLGDHTGVASAMWRTSSSRRPDIVHVAVTDDDLYLPALLEIPLLVIEAMAAMIEETQGWY